MARDVAVLIPCYNEEQTIAKVVKDFRKVLPDARVYVFDNNSSDKTVEKAKAAGAIIEKVTRQGKGSVVREMFQRVEAEKYIMVDGDDTYAAEDAVKMLEMVDEGVDMVVGDRLNSTYFSENKRFGHGFGNVLVRKIINIIFKSKIQDVMTGYRAFSRRFVKTCPILSDGFQVETEMTVHALDKKMNVGSMPIQYRDRPSGSESKLNTVSDGIKVLAMIFDLIKECRPLLFFTCVSLVLLILAAILVVPVCVEYVQTGLVERFPSLIVAVMLILLASMLFIAGMILDVMIKKDRQRFQIALMNLDEGTDE